MNDFVPLPDVAAELGLDRAQTRERLRLCGVRAHKVHFGGAGGPVIHSLTREEAERVRSGCTGREPLAGAFYAVQLVPDLDPRRVRLGFAEDLAARLTYLRAGAPTAVVLKSWPCRPCWVAAALDCLGQDCRPFLYDTVECDDPAGLVARGDRLFTLLPAV